MAGNGLFGAEKGWFSFAEMPSNFLQEKQAGLKPLLFGINALIWKNHL